MILIINQQPDFLKNLTCGCGRPAEIAWHIPIDTEEKPKKLNKTQVVEEKKKKEPQPYGWSCGEHMPRTNNLHPHYLWV